MNWGGMDVLMSKIEMLTFASSMLLGLDIKSSLVKINTFILVKTGRIRILPFGINVHRHFKMHANVSSMILTDFWKYFTECKLPEPLN